jgi:hypothetical protein
MCHQAIASKRGGPEPGKSLFLSRTVKCKLCSVWIKQIERANPLSKREMAHCFILSCLVTDTPPEVSVMAVEYLCATGEGPSPAPQQNISATKLRGL